VSNPCRTRKCTVVVLIKTKAVEGLSKMQGTVDCHRAVVVGVVVVGVVVLRFIGGHTKNCERCFFVKI